MRNTNTLMSATLTTYLKPSLWPICTSSGSHNHRLAQRSLCRTTSWQLNVSLARRRATSSQREVWALGTTEKEPYRVPAHPFPSPPCSCGCMTYSLPPSGVRVVVRRLSLDPRSHPLVRGKGPGRGACSAASRMASIPNRRWRMPGCSWLTTSSMGPWSPLSKASLPAMRYIAP